MAVISGQSFGRRILQDLGLNAKEFKAIYIEIPVEGLVTIRIEKYTNAAECEVLREAFTDYCLTENLHD